MGTILYRVMFVADQELQLDFYADGWVLIHEYEVPMFKFYVTINDTLDKALYIVPVSNVLYVMERPRP